MKVKFIKRKMLMQDTIVLRNIKAKKRLEEEKSEEETKKVGTNEN